MIDTKAVIFQCQGATLHGILDIPETPGQRAVLIVVGGPQYRVGSHRQFALLSRHLADNGIPTMRFDHRGIGDSDGEVSFDQLDPDIAAAVDKLCDEVPEVREIVLWGLCDAASAAMMYAPCDTRIKGLILLNPWVRDDRSLAQTYLKHYYVSQFFSYSFWRRVLTGKVRVAGSLRSFLKNILLAIKPTSVSTPSNIDQHADVSSPTFQKRMELELAEFKGRILFIISGEDLTAAEFKQLVDRSRGWKKILEGELVDWQEVPEADHTFSQQVWRRQVELTCNDWISSW